ncbi:MAG: alpha-galactosidase [Acidobacteria bacterium]|nr:alpha-galactosidase [Acidobacteriota bacterium]
MRVLAVSAAVLVIGGVAGRVDAGSRTVLSSRKSTVVSYDAAATQWVISTGSLDLTVGIGDTGQFEILHLAVPGHDRVNVPGEPESRLVVGHDERWLQDGKDRPIRFVEARTDDYQGGVRLSVVFDDGEGNARITRHYVAYPDAPSFVEVWSEVERLTSDSPIDVSVLAAWRVQVTTRSLRWLRGLETPLEQPDLSFQRQAREVGDGESFSIDSWGRSTSINVPVVVAPAGESGTFVAGLLWSGMWQLDVGGTGDGMRLEANMRDIEITVPAQRSIESAHGFMGVIDADEHGVSNALGRLLMALRGGRGFPRLVTYNPWFVHGVHVTANTIDHEVEVAQALGVEVFQVDAGWYKGAGEQNGYDFTSGLSSYEVDTDKFPQGLRPVGARIRQYGMRFALWVEPERIDRALVDREGSVRESWLATTSGTYDGSGSNDGTRAAQICLAHPDAWQWVRDKLTVLIDESAANYIKIDSNFWVNCSRDGHGHGPRDGNYWHVQGLYSLLKALRERFPDLIIENCAGGGNRIDFGLARYTDVAWMDDRTTPSIHVRHNLEGLLWLLPPSYLLGYTMAAEGEALNVTGDLGLMTRSRMPGVLGFSYRYDELSEFDIDRIAHEVAIHGKARATVGASSYSIVLSQQVARGAEPPWDVVEEVGRDTGGAAIFAFQNATDVEAIRVKPRDLQAGTMYEIYSADRGVVGRISGASLMADGIEILGSPATHGHTFLLTPSGAAPAAAHRK